MLDQDKTSVSSSPSDSTVKAPPVLSTQEKPDLPPANNECQATEKSSCVWDDIDHARYLVAKHFYGCSDKTLAKIALVTAKSASDVQSHCVSTTQTPVFLSSTGR